VKKAANRPRNRERIDSDELFLKLMEIVSLYGGMIRLSVLKNIALLTHSLLTLFSGARGGNGWLSKSALARCLPLDIGPRERERRLYRFLGNPRVTPEVMIPLHIVLACGIGLPGPVPLVLDQTTIRGIETLLVGLVFSGRVLPVAFSCFTYDKIKKSRNALEHGLILSVMACFPPVMKPVLIMDRGYARVSLLLHLRTAGIRYLIRAKSHVIVYLQGIPKSLGRIRVKPGEMKRLKILYHSSEKMPLDLIIFHGKGYKDTWYLLVPRDMPMTTEEIVDLYARRMSIEQGFRDWKTHLGVRGMVFKGEDPAPRLARLLTAFSLSYMLCLALGAAKDADVVRAFVEIPRKKPRHGTARTLSSLSIGILRLSLHKFEDRARSEVFAIIQSILSGKGVVSYCMGPP
jgi:hypothetical protein